MPFGQVVAPKCIHFTREYNLGFIYRLIAIKDKYSYLPHSRAVRCAGRQGNPSVRGESSMIDRSKDGVPSVTRSVQNLVFVRQMLGELRGVAEAENAQMLCYLIEMAMMEASDLVEANGRQRPGGRP